MKFFDKESGVKVTLPRHTEHGMKRLRITYGWTSQENQHVVNKTMIPISPSEVAMLTKVKTGIRNQSVQEVYNAIGMNMPDELSNKLSI